MVHCNCQQFADRSSNLNSKLLKQGFDFIRSLFIMAGPHCVVQVPSEP